ncbi:phosphoribosyltransferase [Candidatus Bathyarchaeota archaeon]|nr:phosphoribosyltransferase [Candidatus Bathyarchaeota archaeon]
MFSLNAQYLDRMAAGKVLGENLKAKNWQEVPLILAIPNGGLAVALPLAKMLHADLDLLIVRKLQIPFNPEAGFGALTSLGTVILNQPLVNRIGLQDAEIQQVIYRTKTQIDDRKKVYKGLVGLFSPKSRVVILVDDGLASGYTMLAAIDSVRQLSPKRMIVAVPTASASAISKVREQVDELICPQVDDGVVFAVADAYEKWYDVPDEEVIMLLREYRKAKPKRKG